MSEKTSLRASGATAIAGGVYGEVRVSASLRVNGTLECDSLSSSGAVRINGDLLCAGQVSCAGSVKAEGSVKMEAGAFSGSYYCDGNTDCSKKLACSGSAQINGDLRCGKGKFSGSCVVGGTVRGNEISCSGRLKAGKDVEAENFYSSGDLEIQGLLNAERMELKVNSICKVSSMGGGFISVQKDWHGFSFGGGKPRLCVRTIEGDTIELESTQAEVVRGKNVRIGRDCEIGRVEFSGELTVDGGTVGEQVRI